MKRSELVKRLTALPTFRSPRAELEQVATPPEAAADLLEAAVARDDLVGRSVLDLGAGTGILGIGAALLGAAQVVAIESDPRALEAAREAADALDLPITWLERDVTAVETAADTVLMNPPFGAQRRHADRPFWDQAFRLARRRIYAFALRDARTFIARRAVARGARIEETAPVPWRLPRSFPHHRKRSVELAVDRWVLSVGDER